MNKKTIEIALKPLIEQVESKLFSNASCITHNISTIVELRKLGVSLTTIIQISGLSLDEKSLSSQIYRSKKKVSYQSNDKESKLGNIVDAENGTLEHENEHKKASSDVEIEPHSNFNKGGYSDEDWIKAFSFTASFHPRALITVVPTLEKAGWNPDNYYILKNKFTILTFPQLVGVVGNISSSRFRKMIFNDGNPIF